MTSPFNQQQYKGSNWNPFIPTKRDIQRTNKLAGKNIILAGALGFLFPVGVLIYLNRGENYFKFVLYYIIINFSLAIMFAIYIVINKDKSYEDIGQIPKILNKVIDVVYEIGRIAATVENIRAITLARKRKSENNF
ncbi:MAG: hypothetical protein KI793_13620 [Rivularia sp. (in: Bacteria)]|nr:hypothetical protein [Rivularia sp. MS3]